MMEKHELTHQFPDLTEEDKNRIDDWDDALIREVGSRMVVWTSKYDYSVFYGKSKTDQRVLYCRYLLNTGIVK